MLSAVRQRLLVYPKSLFGSIYQANNYATEATFKTQPYKLHLLDTGPATEVTMTRDEGLQYYRQMQVIRRMETVAGNLYKAKAIRGFCHLYSGQEETRCLKIYLIIQTLAGQARNT